MIGRKKIKFPSSVNISVASFTPTPSLPFCNRKIIVNGPLGSLELPIFPYVDVKIKSPEQIYQESVASGLSDPDEPVPNHSEALVVVEDPSDRKQKMMWGTSRSLLNSMIEGVTEAFTIPIRLVGVGFRATYVKEDNSLVMKLGYANNIVMTVPDGVEVNVPQPQRLLLRGIDKAKVTQFAAMIRSWRKPEPYNLKGVFVGDETIKKKEGKKR
ncbi:hypothetical protein HK098_006013 [Nowakowskiella sp. JEL0407]|nr:hypothetical protein HK098_006013 [Nowakowskiella sp. JEL0407]